MSKLRLVLAPLVLLAGGLGCAPTSPATSASPRDAETVSFLTIPLFDPTQPGPRPDTIWSQNDNRDSVAVVIDASSALREVSLDLVGQFMVEGDGNLPPNPPAAPVIRWSSLAPSDIGSSDQFIQWLRPSVLHRSYQMAAGSQMWITSLRVRVVTGDGRQIIRDLVMLWD